MTPGPVRDLVDKAVWKVRRRVSSSERFREFYLKGTWGGTESASGPGSSMEETRVLRGALPGIFDELSVRSLLDVPCGDFHWMQHVDLSGIDYIGGDVVPEMVAANAHLAGPNVSFRKLNVITDALPRADLVLCRDCLPHFALRDARRALQNIVASGSTFLLTTTFTDHQTNPEIKTGDFRALNLERPPFSLPSPMRAFNEECALYGDTLRDKSMGLWPIADVRAALAD
jgi:SAM-dependent methyltransferase